MKTLTLNLTEKEMAVVEQLAEAKGLNKTAVMRQALRVYQEIDRRLTTGGRIYFENDKTLRQELVLATESS